jgi:hypothetical protein
MADKVFNIIIKLLKQGGADVETVKGLTDIKNAMVAGMSVVGGFTAAWYTVDKVLKATVGEFATYAKDVDIFSSALGTSADQGSRLIQIADDLGISSSELQTSLFRAVKTGMDPTVEGLAKMADEYVALQDPQKQADFLTKNFGKSSQELARLLAEGGAGIRARNEGIAASLILDQAAIQKQRDYEAALDDSADSVKALKVALGGEWMPFWTNLVNYAVKSVEGWQKGLDALAYNKAVRKLAQEMQDAAGKTDAAGRHVKGLTQNYIDLAAAEIAAQDAKNARPSNPTIDQGAALEALWLKNQEKAAISTNAALRQLSDTYGFIISNAQTYEQTQQGLTEAGRNAAQAQRDLEEVQKATPWDTVKIEQYRQKLSDAAGAYADLDAAAQKANTLQMADLLKTELTNLGMAPDQVMQNVMEYERTHGLISQEAYDDAKTKIADVQLLVKGIMGDDGTGTKGLRFDVDSGQAQANLTAIQTALDNLKDKTITVNVEYSSSGAAPQAAGGDYWVTTPTLFLAGEAGPERATFTPMGRGSTYNNYNTYSGGNEAGMQALLQETREQRRDIQALAERLATALDKRIR